MEVIVFADSNIFLDAFLRREPHHEDCLNILTLARNRKIKLYTSSSCLQTVIYFLTKDGMSNENIVTVISRLFNFLSLKSPDETCFINGLNAGFPDLEDAVQYYTALQIKGIDYFITSNTKYFKKASHQLPVITPSQFMTIYNK